MRRLAPVVIPFLLLVLPCVTQAQTCPPPVVVVAGGTNPACAGQTVTLDAGAGWTTYLWSPGGATTRMIADTPTATTSYWVTTTDANGCSVTSQPLTVVVNAAPSAPSIQLRETTLCGGGNGEATVTGTWSSYAWSVTNGTIASGPNGPVSNGATVDYTASGAGPVGVSVTVTDSNGCAVTTSVDVPLRTIPKPTVQTTPTTICPGSFGDAWVNPPAEGGSWQSYHWTVLNGTIASWSGDSSSTVGFTSSPSGQPVAVQVTVTDIYGCSATSDPVAIPVRSIAKPTVQTTPTTICPGSFGDAWVNPPAEGGSWQSYHWTVTNGTIASWSGDSSSTVGFTSSPSGQPVTVQVTVTDTYGCTATSDPVAIPVRSIAKPTVQTTPTTICPGSFGDAWVNPPAEGGSWQSYHWTVTNGTIASWSGDSGSTVGFTSSPSGQPVTVQVTVTDTYGCTATSDPVGIPVRSIAKPTVQTTPTTICPGSFGDAWVNPPAEGGSWQSYHWTVTNGTIASWSGDSSSTVGFISSPSGQLVTVQVTVTDTYGCTATSDPVTIPVRSLSPPVITVDSSSVCTGSYVQAHIDSPAYPNGPWQSVTWTATNALRPSGGMTIPNDTSFFATATGGPVTLTVAVTDMNGCSATSTVEIPAATNPPTAVMTIPPKVCAGTVFTVTAHDPAGVVQNFQFYATNATNQSIEAGGAATFVANGPGPVDIYATTMDSSSTCAVYGHASTVAVTPVAATITPSGPTALCAGGSVTLTAPDGMLTYNWSTGATSQAITVTDPGSYTVTISNAPGCSSTSAATVVTVSTPTAAITASGPTTFCTGGSVTLTANSGASYLWSNGATTRAIAVSTAGNYTVTVTDANGCSAVSAPATVTVNPAFFADIWNSPPGVIGFGDGSDRWCEGTLVTLTAKPDGMTYLWSTGQTTQSITVNTEATYSVMVTNATGCARVSSANVWFDPAPKPVINPPASTSFCGSMQLTVNAVAGGQYTWVRQGAGNLGTGPSVTILDAGTYYVLAQYSDGCSSQSDSIVLTRLPDPQGAITASTPKLCPGGSVTLTASVSDDNATFLWATGETTRTLVVSAIGYYTVHVTQTNGCAFDLGYNLTADPASQPSITAFPSNATVCDGGSVNLFCGGSDPVQWSNGATASQIDVTTEGDYFFIRIDQYGCPHSSNTVHVTIKPLPAKPVITAGGPTTFCYGSGSVTLMSSPGAAYRWSYGATTQSIVANTTGDYTVQVFGANGCWSTPSDPIHVTANTPPVAWISASGPTTFCSGQSVTLTANGGTTVHWTTGETTRSITVTSTGNYSVTTSDDNGCSNTSAPMSVTVNPSPSAAITPSGPTTFCDGGSVTLTAAVASSYAWSNGATTRAITVSSSGTFSVVVTGANGCSVTSAPTVVTVNPIPVATITASGPTTFCAGGSVTLTAATAASYAWSTGATTQSIAVSATGDYTVTVTNSSGCTKTSAAVHVTANTLPSAAISTPSIICTSSVGENAQVPNIAGATYNWTITNGTITNPALSSITYLPSGVGPLTLNVTVTDANGCVASGSKTVSVTEPPTPSISASGATTFCAGGSVTLSGPVGYQQYIWNTAGGYLSNYARQIVVNTNSWYELQVRDATGCLSPRSARVTVTVNAQPANPIITASGPTQFCAGGSVTLTATSAASYLWSNGETTQSIVVSASGNYSVTTTDANGCSATSMSPKTVTVLAPPPTPTVTGPATFCPGSSTTLTSSYSPYGYHWSNGATTQSIAVSAAGSYSVTTTDFSGCSATSAATIVTANALPTATITAGGPTTFCPGGSVTLTAGAASSYSWSTGATTQSITVSNSGSYSVTVTGANGCHATSVPTVVTVNTPPAATITAGGPTTFCPGGNVTLTASSGASYLWSTGATTPSITVNSSGSYSVTVTSANGCSATSAPTSVTAATPQTATITPTGSTSFCAGSFVHLTASSGSSYLWSTGSTSQSIDVNASGSYSVTVTDANGCSTTSAPTTTTMYPYVEARITPSGPTTFCAGGSVTLTASGGVSYRWLTNGDTTPSIVVTTSGTYFVTVTDAHGCSASTSYFVTVNPNPQPVVTAGGPTTFCAGGSVTLTASSASSYLWSNGATTQSITVNSSGSYGVTVTDAKGCQGTSAPTVVTVNAPPSTITAGGPTTFCAGGSVTLTASSGASYLWSTGATTASIIASTSGSYSVSVTDANGCSTTSAPTIVTANAYPTAAITAGGPTTFCAGGSVTLTASSGASYLWSTGATTSSITASSSGSYSVTVTSAAGCSATSSPTTVTVNANPTASITAGGPTTFCAGGSVTLTASSGASYLWSTGATTSSIVAGSSGNYSVTVTNAAGCSTTSSPTTVTVNANPVATITPGGPTTFCAGGNVTLTASSGASYLWSTGATTQAITVNATGNYTVAVTNANGCSTTSAPAAVTVNANPPTPVITAGGPTTFCAGGSVTLTASSGSSYLWSTGATTSSIVASSSGNYSVTVTNANGCSTTSAPTAVTINANPAATITPGGPTTFCTGGNVTLTASSGASYLWSTGATTSSITVNATGNYSVAVTNAAGCSATSTPTTVTVNANPTATITASGPTTYCIGGSVTLTASSGASYWWSNGQTTPSITISDSFSYSGSYSVTVTNANGCSATSSPMTVTSIAGPTPGISSIGPTTFCAGGSVTLTASGGTSYLWSTGATTPSISVSSSGNYSATVTDANGCSATTASMPVTVNAAPPATITPNGPTTFCTGSNVTLTAPAGYTYTWSNSATTQSIMVSASGSYSVTVRDANGCSTTSAPAVVSVRAKPTAAVSGGGTICQGASATITATLTGTAPWTVTWSDGNIQTINSGTTATRNVSPAATKTYTVTTLTDATCSGTSSGSAVVTVKPVPAASVSGGGTICPGASATISAALTGTAPWSVTWSDGNIQTINSGTTATRSLSPAATTTYTVTSVSDAQSCPRAGTGSALVTVKTLPTATVSGGGAFCPGGSVTITATLTGTAPWSVTWSDGNIQTINSGAVATRSVSPAATTTYTVTSVSDANSCPRAGTGSALVTRNVAASITTQPSNKTTTRNTNVTLSVVAAGTAPISYQWHLGNGTIISGATSSSYTTSFSSKGTNTFYVEVWNACNTTNVRSNTATVTVN